MIVPPWATLTQEEDKMSAENSAEKKEPLEEPPPGKDETVSLILDFIFRLYSCSTSLLHPTSGKA